MPDEAFEELDRAFAAEAKPEGQRTVRYGGLTMEDYDEDRRMASEVIKRAAERYRARKAKEGANRGE